MKTRFLPALFIAVALFGADEASADFRNKRVVTAPAIIADVLLLRPFGAALTMAGGALFVGTLPITLLATIPEPHDAVPRTAHALVEAPAAFTFNRPLGEMSYQPSGVYPLRPEEPLGTGAPDGYVPAAAPTSP